MALDPQPAPTSRQTGPEREEWRVCTSYPAYSVSSRGRVRHEASHSIMQTRYVRGHPCVRPHRDGKRGLVRVASLVAEAFCGLPSLATLRTAHRLHHRNGNPADNRPANLLVVSRLQRSDRDLELADSLRASGLTYRVIRKLTGVSSKVLKRRRPPSG